MSSKLVRASRQHTKGAGAAGQRSQQPLELAAVARHQQVLAAPAETEAAELPGPWPTAPAAAADKVKEAVKLVASVWAAAPTAGAVVLDSVRRTLLLACRKRMRNAWRKDATEYIARRRKSKAIQQIYKTAMQ